MLSLQNAILFTREAGTSKIEFDEESCHPSFVMSSVSFHLNSICYCFLHGIDEFLLNVLSSHVHFSCVELYLL